FEICHFGAAPSCPLRPKHKYHLGCQLLPLLVFNLILQVIALLGVMAIAEVEATVRPLVSLLCHKRFDSNISISPLQHLGDRHGRTLTVSACRLAVFPRGLEGSSGEGRGTASSGCYGTEGCPCEDDASCCTVGVLLRSRLLHQLRNMVDDCLDHPYQSLYLMGEPEKGIGRDNENAQG
ncbi:hypothetical protein BHE74_00027969, partial [Ensete ventricosum]